MGTLTVGRVGLDVAMSDPASWNERRGGGSRETIITGFLKSSSLANTKALRTELLEQQGTIVAITYSLDDSMNGFYLLSDANVETVPVSFSGVGLFPYEITAHRIGGSGAVEFQSLITGGVRDNQHGLISGEVQPIHAPAQGHVAYRVDAGTPVQDTVSTEDGDLNRYYNMSFNADPSWSVEPENYYSAGAYIKTNGLLRAGLDAPSNPADFEIGNKIIKIVPSTSASVSDGRLDISWWTGSAYTTAYGFELYHITSRIPEFHYTSILTNTPEVCRLRVVRDAEDPSSIQRHVVDLEVRRGCAYVSVTYTYTASSPTYLKILQEGSSETLTSVTPTGATDATSYESTNGWTVGSSRTITNEAGAGGIRITNKYTSGQRDFFIGYQLGVSTPDTVEDIALQYHGPLSALERAVRR